MSSGNVGAEWPGLSTGHVFLCRPMATYTTPWNSHVMNKAKYIIPCECPIVMANDVPETTAQPYFLDFAPLRHGTEPLRLP